MWEPLPDRFIDERLLEMFPLFGQTQLQLVDVMNPAAVDTLQQLPPSLSVNRVEARTVGWPQSWRDTVGFLSYWLHGLTCPVARRGVLLKTEEVVTLSSIQTVSVACWGIPWTTLVNFLTPYPFSCVRILIKIQSFCHQYLKLNNSTTK